MGQSLGGEGSKEEYFEDEAKGFHKGLSDRKDGNEDKLFLWTGFPRVKVVTNRMEILIRLKTSIRDSGDRNEERRK